MNHWAIEDSETELARIIQAAEQNEPQIITVNGRATAVVLPMSYYQKRNMPQGRLSEFFRRAPLAEAEIDLNQDRHDVY